MKQTLIKAIALPLLAMGGSTQAQAMNLAAPLMDRAQDAISLLTIIPSRHGWKVFVAAALLALALDRLRARNSGRFEY